MATKTKSKEKTDPTIKDIDIAIKTIVDCGGIEESISRYIIDKKIIENGKWSARFCMIGSQELRMNVPNSKKILQDSFYFKHKDHQFYVSPSGNDYGLVIIAYVDEAEEFKRFKSTFGVKVAYDKAEAKTAIKGLENWTARDTKNMKTNIKRLNSILKVLDAK